MMDLKEFVSVTLQQVAAGISEAQGSEGGGIIAPSNIGVHKFAPGSGVSHDGGVVSTAVQFDVAVTAEASDVSSGQAGVKVYGNRAGLEGEAGRRDLPVSRVQFSMHMVMPPNLQRLEGAASPPTQTI